MEALPADLGDAVYDSGGEEPQVKRSRRDSGDKPAVTVSAVEKWSLPKRKNPHIVVEPELLMGFQPGAPPEHVAKRDEFLAVGRVVCLVCAKALTAGKQILFRHQTLNIEHREAVRKGERASLAAILSASPLSFEARKSISSVADGMAVEDYGPAERESGFPMVGMAEAVQTALLQASPLEAEQVSLDASLSRVAAETVLAPEPFPPFAAAIMDGYAVAAPLAPGQYAVSAKTLAGGVSKPVAPGTAVYITTGAQMPPGSNAVVKFEDTRGVPGVPEEEAVEILVKAEPGANVRQAGSDISAGETLVVKGSRVTPTEIGLLATFGLTHLRCVRRPVVGVLSTGDELVDCGRAPGPGQIRDSNRPSLLSSLRAEGFEVRDLGIVGDNSDRLREVLARAAVETDVLLSSGGVSMGQADLVKPLLSELGTLHFGRLNMKPGNPTTFATLRKSSGTGLCLFFGLPGNPVSCLVCKQLLVDPVLRRLQGLPMEQCLPPRVRVRTLSAVQQDPERPEFHRVRCSFSLERSEITATSTGGQRSSRLQSMAAANALMLVPAGQGALPAGSSLIAYSTAPLAELHENFATEGEGLGADLAAYFDCYSGKRKRVGRPKTAFLGGRSYSMRVALLTVSDRASAGQYADLSGPEMRNQLLQMTQDESWPANLSFSVVAADVVPDEPSLIQQRICDWCEGTADVVLTSGGTGFGARDFTPEAVRPLLHKEAPGVAFALVQEGLKHTSLAVLSRPVAGTRNSTFVCTLPGSVKAVQENMVALRPLLPRIVELLVAESVSSER